MEKLDKVKEKSDLCRVCLGLGEYDIYNGVMVVDDKNFIIDEILKEFTSLDLENLDLNSSQIPTLICSLCSDRLIQCFQFLQQIQHADDYIMNLLRITPPIQNNDNNDYDLKTGKLGSEIEDEEIEEYTVHIVDEFGDELICQDPLTNDNINITEIPKEIKNERKRKTNNKKKPNLILTEKVSNILSHIHQNVSECDDNDCDNINENINTSKKLKISNIDSSIEDVAFVITKFIPNETINTTINPYDNNEIHHVNQTDESTFFQSNNDITKTQSIIRTYDLAAVEIDPTDKNEFEKLLVKNYDEDDDENDDDDNSDSNGGAVYACQYCTRAFSSSQFLKQHIRKTHVCQFCMKGFEKREQLFEHIRNSHSKFNCPFCQKSYKSNSNLRQHMKKIHTFKLPAHTSLLAFSKKDENVLISNQNDGTSIE